MRRTLLSPLPPAARALTLAALAALAALTLALPAWATKVTFRYQPVIGGVSKVAVAGSFNGWNATANPMADVTKDGIWTAELDLPPGRIEYKFVVNGDQWFTDENAADFSSDGFGGQNAILVVGDKPVVAGYGTTVKKIDKPQAELHKVTFTFHPPGTPDKVCVAGAFNDWTVGKTPLTGPDAKGDWSTTVLLAPGAYPYKFVTGDTGWTQDKTGQDAEVDDGYGGKNSVRNVDDRYPKVEVNAGDGNIFPDGIEHTQGSNEINNLGRGRVEFTARAHRGDITGIDLVTWPAGVETSTPMRLANIDKVFEYYRATVTLPAGETPYVFRYHDGVKTMMLTPKGLQTTTVARFMFDDSRFPAFTTPDWVKNGIIYQIFPDRFRNGDPSNDQDFHEWYYDGKKTAPAAGTMLNTDLQEYYHLVKPWEDYQALTHNPYTKDGRDWMGFYGGDIEGVRKSLDYLKGLGVTIIYFNPIFEAKSTHKYDAADYKKIDPHYGTNAQFIAFVREAKAKGIHVILDIVYNHSGNAHWAFRDAVEKGPKSPYYQWYEFKQWPLPAGWPNVDHAWKPGDYYDCWWGFGDLPGLNFDLGRQAGAENGVHDIRQAQVNIPLVNYLLDTTEYWLKDADVDGVRLDVPNEVPFWFWTLFNQRVKKVKPDAYIVGELWGNATDYVKPGIFDAVMNYAFFRDPVTKFIGMGQGSAGEFDATLATGRLAYPSQAVAAQMNLIDSHDTVRFLTQVDGDAKRLMLAALFEMTYVGAPTIYYGDEIAMQGGKDPDCRRPFVWSWQQEPERLAMHDWYSKLTALRLAHPALRTGDFRTVHAAGMTYGFARSDGKEDFLVVLNAGRQDGEVAIDLAPWGGAVKAADALQGGASASWSGTARITVPAESGRIFQLTRAK